MKIKQYNPDGSADIIFDENEIKIINEKGKLHYDPTTFKHLVNSLARIVFTFSENFPEELKNLKTTDFTKIEGK
tara:strand:+ start:181 stop:402 length:222 start_codon:yes stop_codon:yes gene_type:complete